MSRTGGAGALWSSMEELEEAAKKGNSRALAQLGEMRLKGDQTPQNVAQGVELLEKAAKAGEATAAFALGKAYDDGALVPVDRTRAYAYYRAAAAGKVPEAFFNLGAAYASARGVKRDYAEGLAWLILARKAGVENDGEQRLRERLTSQRRGDLIEKAEKRAQEIDAELTEKNVTGLLPDAPSPTPSTAPATTRLSAPSAVAPETRTVPLNRGNAASPPPPAIPAPAPAIKPPSSF
ncbi:MAG TPA: hypothetical protein PLN52_10970 [Opitutaceae bacterium]|nr:hypothetical protein [Opitutaceae bacterium]